MSKHSATFLQVAVTQIKIVERTQINENTQLNIAHIHVVSNDGYTAAVLSRSKNKGKFGDNSCFIFIIPSWTEPCCLFTDRKL